MGGGAMKAAAKMAGIAASGSGIRSIASEHCSAIRKAASLRPAASTSEEMKLVAKNLEDGVQRPILEMDDWVLADTEEAAGDGMARVVFGDLPSFEEAKEATCELSDSLEKAFFSSPASGVSQGIDSDNQDVETKTCVTAQMSVAPLPASTMMAFRFLHESPQAQNVVASIACDPNVWNAVLQNHELQQYLQSQMAYMNSGAEPFVDYDGADKDSGSASDCDAKSFTDSSKLADFGFLNIFESMKNNVVDMVRNLSDYMQNLFGGKGSGGVFVNSDGNARVSAETAMNASFMGLAVMAVLVILLKRAN